MKSWILTRAQSRGWPSRAAFLFLANTVLAFLVYLKTLAPTVYTFDSAEFATGAYCLGIIHSTGYPLYLLLAKLFTYLPVGDIAYRVNVMSAVWGALTVGLLFLLCFRLTRREWLSTGAALFYGLSHFIWPEAVIAETYTLNTTLVLVILLLLLTESQELTVRRTGLAGLAFGLGMANHMSTILLIPALLYWAIARRPNLKSLLVFGMLVLIGLLFYLYLPIRYAADPPLNYAKAYFQVDLATVEGIYAWVSGKMFRPFMIGYQPLEVTGEIGNYVLWLWNNFLGAGVLIGLAGNIVMLRARFQTFAFLTLVYVAYTGFFINYRVVNKDTMFAVSYLVWSIWLAYGASAIQKWLDRSRMVPPATVAAFLAALVIASLIFNYAWADQSNNRQAREIAGQLLDNVAPSAFVVTEWTWATPLEYLQIVEKRRPDVVIFDRGLEGLAVWGRIQSRDSAVSDLIEQDLVQRIQSELARRPVYATEYDETLARQFDFVAQSSYYRLLPRTTSGTLP